MHPDGPRFDAPLGEYAAPAPSPKRGRRSALIGGTAVLAVMACVVAVLALWPGDDERDADQALARAQQFVAQAQSVRFEYHAEFVAPGFVEEGDEAIDGTGEWSPDAWHVEERSGEDLTEVVVSNGTVYYRSTYDDASIEDETWYSFDDEPFSRDELREFVEFFGEMVDQANDPDAPDDLDMGDFADTDSVSVLVGLMVFLNNFGSTSSGVFIEDPAAFLDGIRRLAEPTIVAEDGSALTLGAAIPIDQDLVDAFGHPIPDVAAELDVDGDDVPTALRLSTAAGASRLSFEIRFSGWGEPVSVAVPDPALVEIEDESDFYGDVPTEVPVLDGVTPLRIGDAAGEWKIRSADVFDDECASLDLVWTEGDSRFSIMSESLWMEIMPRDCLEEWDWEGDVPVAADGSVAVARSVEGDYPMNSWIAVTGDTVALVNLFTPVVDGDREAEIMAALEPTDWDTIQLDLATE
jgi:hypothetical protein